MRKQSPLLLLLPLLLGVYSSHAQLIPHQIFLPRGAVGLPDTTVTLNTIDQVSISVYYTGVLKRPRFMALNSRGEVCVADPGRKAVLKLVDLNHDQIIDTAIVIAPGDDSTHSIAFHDSSLYVSGSSMIHRYQDRNHDGYYETEVPFITGIHSLGVYDHYTRTILFDDQNRRLLVGVGASCNACRESDSDRGTILRLDQDGTNRTVLATGLRNVIGMDIDKWGEVSTSGTLWAGSADRDYLGNDTPTEAITRIDSGGFFGWPLAYGDRRWIDFNTSNEYKALLPISHEDSIRVSNMKAPDIVIPAHSTPMGVACAPQVRIPALLDHLDPCVLVALHGSSPPGRSVATGYKVVRITREDQSSKYILEDFVTGFLTDSIQYKYFGRPCGIISDGNAGFYLSSDQGVPAIYYIDRYVPSGSIKPNATRSEDLIIEPNPAVTKIRISNISTVGGTLSVRDIVGRTLLSKRATGLTDEFDLTAIPSGVYYCTLTESTGMKLAKLLIQH